MSKKELWEMAQASFVSWAVVAIAGGFAWLVRRIFTNQAQIREMRNSHQAQIDMMKTELKARDDQRGRDRQDLLEVKQDVKEIRSDIQGIFRREK